MVRCTRERLSAWDFFFLSEVGKRNSRRLAAPFLFSPISFSVLYMHGGSMGFMLDLGTAFEAWCFSFIYDIYDNTA